MATHSGNTPGIKSDAAKKMNLPTFFSCMRRFAPLLLVLVSATAAVAAYLQALNYPFVSDDFDYIVNNTKLAGLHLAELGRLFTETFTLFPEPLPLRDFSYWLDIKLFGLTPSAFRLHNILLYLLCLPLVYGTTLSLWRHFCQESASSAPWAAAAVTALFALHPAHVETVVWVSGRKDVLSGMFSMLALWFAVNAKREHGLFTPYAATALIALLAAMLSKASAFAVAPIIVMLWVLFWLDIPAPNRRRSLLLWPLASLLLAACISLVFATVITSKVPFYFGVEALTRSLAVLGWLTRLAVSPESRHFFYPVFEDPHLPAMITLGSIVLAAAVTGGVLILRKHSLECFTLVAFFLLCLPSLQLIPYAPPSLVSDRFLFLAAWPAMLLVVATIWRLKPLLRIALLPAIALLLGFQTIERPHDWRSFEALVDTDLRAYPGHYLPATYKIITIQLPQRLYRDAGETANNINSPELQNIMVRLVYADNAVHIKSVTTGKPLEAMTLMQDLGAAVMRPPDQIKWNPSMRYTLGYCQERLTLLWNHLARQFPNDESVRYSAGLWMLEMHQFINAAAHLRAATESQRLPESVRGTALYSLGLALMNSGHVAEAEVQLRAALEQALPDLRAYCLLSAVYTQTGRLEDAARTEAGCHRYTASEKATR